MSTIAAHHYLSICHLRKQENIAISLPVLQRFDSAFFQTLPNVNVHPGVAVYHTLKIFSIVNAKDFLMPHTKFQVCTLKINTIFCHREKKSHYFWTGVYIKSNRFAGRLGTFEEVKLFAGKFKSWFRGMCKDAFYHYDDVPWALVTRLKFLATRPVVQPFVQTKGESTKNRYNRPFVTQFHRRPIGSVHKFQWYGMCVPFMTPSSVSVYVPNMIAATFVFKLAFT